MDGEHKDKWYVGATLKRQEYNRHSNHRLYRNGTYFHCLVYKFSLKGFSFEDAFEKRILWEGKCGRAKVDEMEKIFIKKMNSIRPHGFNDTARGYCGGRVNEEDIPKEILEKNFTIPQASEVLGKPYRPDYVSELVRGAKRIWFMENNNDYPPLVPKVAIKMFLGFTNYKKELVKIGEEQNGVCGLWVSQKKAKEYVGSNSDLVRAAKPKKFTKSENLYYVPSLIKHKKSMESLVSIEGAAKMLSCLGFDYFLTAKYVRKGKIPVVSKRPILMKREDVEHFRDLMKLAQMRKRSGRPILARRVA